MNIGKDKVVLLRYRLSNGAGEVLEDALQDAPGFIPAVGVTAIDINQGDTVILFLQQNYGHTGYPDQDQTNGT